MGMQSFFRLPSPTHDRVWTGSEFPHGLAFRTRFGTAQFTNVFAPEYLLDVFVS